MRALPATFAVHMAMVAIALGPALVLGDALTTATGTLGMDVTPKGVWLDVLAGHGLGRGVLHWFLAATGLSILTSAPLQMTWLFALDGAPGFLALHRGLARTPAAWTVSLLIFAFGGLAFLASLCLPLGAHLALHRLHDERLHDLFVLALTLPAALIVIGGACAHDLARASLVDGRVGPIRAVASACAALRSTYPARYLGFLVLEGLLTLLALDADTRGGSAIAASVAMIAAQLLLFARTITRSVWLALCVRDTPDPTLRTTSRGPSRGDVETPLQPG